MNTFLAMPESEENSILGDSIYHAVNFQVIYRYLVNRINLMLETIEKNLIEKKDT